MRSNVDTVPELGAALVDLRSEGEGLRAELEKQSIKARLFGDPAPAKQSIGRFEVLRPIGRGGMGEVFAARDPELDRKVAIKLVTEASSRHTAERFAREGRALARLSHPNIVQVYEVGQHEGSLFIAMELVEGTTLTRWVVDEDTGRHRPWREILRAYTEAGRGLAAAHAAGLVHRDFKPDNVMMGADGRARVLDFGLARAASEEPTQTSGVEGEPAGGASSSPGADSMRGVTATGTVLGTPAYMAPEQHRGEPATAASDQYAFCVALYEALHGARPFVGGTRAAIYDAIVKGRRAPVPGSIRLPRRITRALWRGLSAAPRDRFASMEALLSALDVDRRRRLGAASVGLLGLGLAAGLAVRGAGEQGPAPCAGFEAQAEGELPGVWDAERKGAIEAAFVATGVPFADRSWAATEAIVSEWASELGAARLDACRAHHVERTESAERFDQRMACLQHAETQMLALGDELSQVDVEGLVRAVEAADALPSVKACASIRPSSGPAVELDPSQQGELDQIRGSVARARAQRQLGKYSRALELARDALDRAEALGHRPLTSEVRLELGLLEVLDGSTDDGLAELETAGFDAQRDANDALAAESWSTLAELAHNEIFDLARGRRWLLQADVAYERAGRRGDEAIEVELLARAGALHRLAGSLVEAEATLQAVVVHHRRRADRSASPGHRLELATALEDLGNVHQDRGEAAEALALFREAREIRSELLGDQHPHTITTTCNVGVVLVDQGELDRARVEFERALRAWEAGGELPVDAGLALQGLASIELAEGRVQRARARAQQALALYRASALVVDLRVAMALDTLGVIEFQAGDLEASRDAYARALALYEQVHGPEHLEVGLPASNLGETLVALGHFEDALPLFERAEQVLAAALGPDAADLAYPLKGRGLALLGLGRDAEAQPALERARTLSSGVDDHERGEIALGLGLLLVDDDPSRARALADESRASLADPLGRVRMQRLLRLLDRSLP